MPVKIKGAPGGEGGDAPGGSGGTWRRLYLVRHGEVAYFCADGRPADPWEVSLNANGKAQADRFATALSGCGAELLMTSAVPRAIQTAAILAAGMNLTPVVDACWNELRPGDLAAFPPARLHGVIVDAYRRAAEPGACFFGGEGFADFARRAGDALEHRLTSRSWSTAVVVTHDPVLRFLVARCLGLGLGACGFSSTNPDASM